MRFDSHRLPIAAVIMASSTRMGAEADSPLALKRAINKGLEPNSAVQRINYLEIYEPDVLADETQPVLGYGASLFVR